LIQRQPPALPRIAGTCLALALPAFAAAAPVAPGAGLCRADAYLDGYRDDLPRDGDRASAPTELRAEALSALKAGDYDLTGAAEARRADQRLAADRLQYRSEAQTALAEGNVRYQDRGLFVAAERADADLGKDTTTLTTTRYQLIGGGGDDGGMPTRGNGTAAQARVEGGSGKQVTHLQDVSFSTCDPGDRDWEITAREMTLDQASGEGQARGMRLRFKDTTLFALPYATFPIDDRRRSGFLLPSIGGGNNGGFDLLLPYYLNLAPNYDATLAPRIVSDRGLMAGGEFRWLTPSQRGEFSGAWMPNDREADRSRFSYSFKHVASLSPNFFVVSDINRVSDTRYFEDFGDSLSAAATSLLPSTAYLYGRGAWWNLSFGGDDIEVTDPRIGAAAEPYRRLPRLTLDLDYPLAEHVRLGLRSEAVSFDKDDYLDDAGQRVDPVTGQRYDLQPYVAFPFERAWGYLRPELAWRETRYSLDGIRGDSRSRGQSIASLDAGLYFDRPLTLFGSALRQTLEPRLYYLRVPYRDQSNLPLFDTQELTFSFAQLFRPNRFTGADRQMDANQLTLAVSTRLLEDGDNSDWLRASLGRIQYFDDRRVDLATVCCCPDPADFLLGCLRNPVPGQRPVGSPSFGGQDDSASAWAAEIELRPSDGWRLAVSQYYDSDDRRTDLSSVRIQHQFGPRGVANLSYRFRRDLLEQVDASTAFPLNDKVRLIARWNYSLRDERTLEALAGLEWGDCCYSLRLLGRHYVRNVQGDTANALFVELELKGLGSLGRRSEDFLRRAILGYR
jgi:LPS-assembly protein